MAGGAEWGNDRLHLIDQIEEIGADTSPEPPPDALLEQALRMLAPTDDPAMLGRLGRYEVCGVIGFGSTGVVYKAFDRSLNRFVAIKHLAAGYSAAGAARARFAREGRAIAAVRDEHVIAIHGVDESGGVPFIVMQYVPGGSLQRRIDEQGPMSTAEVARVAMQIASGLAAAHRHGIVHRDVKPANVLLEDGVERAVVTDFGLARVTDEATVTHTGSITGTPQF
ncbi:MAG: serine/threonine protein kinase, partial [Planctomycetes bacterium]|nr:serine/threonine protein kinase [Planctomycetota bacterium]